MYMPAKIKDFGQMCFFGTFGVIFQIFMIFSIFASASNNKWTVSGRVTGLLLGMLDRISIVFMKINFFWKKYNIFFSKLKFWKIWKSNFEYIYFLLSFEISIFSKFPKISNFNFSLFSNFQFRKKIKKKFNKKFIFHKNNVNMVQPT